MSKVLTTAVQVVLDGVVSLVRRVMSVSMEIEQSIESRNDTGSLYIALTMAVIGALIGYLIF